MSMVENDQNGENVAINREPPAHGGDELLARLDEAFPDSSENQNMAVPNEDLMDGTEDENISGAN